MQNIPKNIEIAFIDSLNSLEVQDQSKKILYDQHFRNITFYDCPDIGSGPIFSKKVIELGKFDIIYFLRESTSRSDLADSKCIDISVKHNIPIIVGNPHKDVESFILKGLQTLEVLRSIE